jgi:hypothetical protein
MSGISDEEAHAIMDAAIAIRRDMGEMLAGKPTSAVFIAIGMLLGDVAKTPNDVEAVCNEIKSSALGHRGLLDAMAKAKEKLQ